jgi:two-component system, sensor histidine kinase and response regulator
MMQNMLQINFENGYILAAEDSLVQAKQIKRFFDVNDIRSTICQNGAEAIEAARKEKPLLIISDIVMPIMDGYEFCTQIKQDPELSDIPFILLTSLSDPLDIIKGLQAGADNFITKPYEDDYLLSRIKYLLANRQLQQMGSGDMSIDILFQNQKFKINSNKKQILDLLLSVYEAAINRNEHLLEARRQLQSLNEELQSANKELEAFAHTVSHDLRSPLSGVIGFAELTQMMYKDSIDEKCHQFLRSIILSANNMAQLIEDLLQFSKSGRSEIDPEAVDLSAMAKEIIRELRQSNFTTNYITEVEDNIVVQADPGMMRVVLNNLLGNALKYSQKATTPTVYFGAAEMNKRQVIYVRDNGVGFDMDKADSIFKPFIRFHTKDEFQGTGVGLSTVKRIIDRHGGSIWFNSAPGKGSTFYFTIN